MNQICCAGHAFAESDQLLADKFPGRVLRDGKPDDLTCFVRDDREDVNRLPSIVSTVRKSIA